MCKDCKARVKMAREALLGAKPKEALSHIAKGAAEIVGVKQKTGQAELDQKTEKTGGKK